MSDEGTVGEAVDSRTASEFCGVKFSNQVPDCDALGRFRNLLLKNGLQEHGLLLKKRNHRGFHADCSTNVHDVTTAPELLTGEETVCIWRQWVSGHENGKMPLLGAIRGSGFIIR